MSHYIKVAIKGNIESIISDNIIDKQNGEKLIDEKIEYIFKNNKEVDGIVKEITQNLRKLKRIRLLKKISFVDNLRVFMLEFYIWTYYRLENTPVRRSIYTNLEKIKKDQDDTIKKIIENIKDQVVEIRDVILLILIKDKIIGHSKKATQIADPLLGVDITKNEDLNAIANLIAYQIQALNKFNFGSYKENGLESYFYENCLKAEKNKTTEENLKTIEENIKKLIGTIDEQTQIQFRSA